MKKIYKILFLSLSFCCFFDFVAAQTYTDGGSTLQLTVYQLWRRTYGDAGFGNAEDSYRIQLRDNSNLDGADFLLATNSSDGNNGWCFYGGGSEGSYPRTETPNRLVLNYSYGVNNPMYYDIYYDTWEDDRGGRCVFNGNGNIFQDDDDARCGPGTISSRPIRSLGAPCVNNSAGWQYFCGTGSSNSTGALIQARYTTPVPQIQATVNACNAVLNSSINGAGSYSGCTYTWERSGDGNVATTQNLTTSTPGSYRVTYNCNSCSSTSPWLVVNASGSAPNAGAISGTQTSCAGAVPAVLGNTTTPTGSGTLTYQWQQSTTSCSAGWSNISGATALTYAPPALSQTTYFRRAVTDCWGRVSYSACVTVTVPQPTVLANHNDAVTCSVSGNNYIHFVSGNRLVMSINPNGANLGNVTATAYVDANVLNIQDCNATQPWFNTATLQRHFRAIPTNNPSGSISVRLYFAQSELSSLITASTSNQNTNDNVTAIGNLKMTKYSGLNEDGLFPNNCGNGNFSLFNQIASGNANSIITGFDANGRYAQFTIPSFSEFWLHGSSDNSPLPVELMHFNAKCVGDSVLLDWKTASEINNAFFIVEKSTDMMQWTEVGRVSGAGNSNTVQLYSLVDETYGKSLYYRLKQQDFDGKFEIFNPVYVNCKNSQEVDKIHVFPNPAFDEFTVQVFVENSYNKAMIQLIDQNGRMVNEKQVSLEQGMNHFLYKTTHLAAGTYSVNVSSENLSLPVTKLIVIK